MWTRTISQAALWLVVAGILSPAHSLTQEELVARIQAAGCSQVSDVKSTHEGTTVKALKNGKQVRLVVDSRPDQRAKMNAITQGTVVAREPATETLRGVIDSVDQANDTIKIRLSQDKTEQFKVQDGLIFNAVRYGDQVEVSVQNIAGAKTIVGLKE